MQLGLPFSTQVGPELYFVRNRRARRYLLRLDHEGRVRVTIPRGGSQREATAFAGRHRDWITRQHAAHPGSPDLPVAETRALVRRARLELPEQLRALAAAHNLILTRVTIRNQRSRWGSCGRNGHITLNWRLVRMPPWVRDYVLVHELMHLRRMDHSPEFWADVAAACPNYKAARAWLRAHGRGL